MKKNYNPYTVPEGFFEESARKAEETYREKKRKLKYTCLSFAVVAAVLIAIPVFINQDAKMQGPVKEECQTNNLAMMYDNDIFLQVNF